MSVVADFSSVCCTVAGVAGCAYLARRPRASWSSAVSALAFMGLAAWAVVVSVYVRAPLSALRAHTLLTLLCLASAPWPAAALAVGDQHIAEIWVRWRGALVALGCIAASGAVIMWLAGIDWITGIGPEPAVVLTRWGLLASAGAAVACLVALVVLVAQWRAVVGATPALMLGAVGGAASLLWVSSHVLWHSYLSLTPLMSATALSGASALLWTLGIVRERPAGAALAPSRRLVYGASALSIALVYLLMARVAFEWLAALARSAVPAILPAFAFAAFAGLVIVGTSKRWRHRLWVAVGRYLFGSKHDYGEIWIRLTELVSSAQTARELLQRAVTLCRDVLCVGEVNIWLTDSRGRLWRTASAAGAPAEVTADGLGEATVRPTAEVPVPANDTALTTATRSSFASPMRVNGRLLGVVAVGAHDRREHLDKEDRRVVQYISAQIGSALGLYKLGEEVADAREVGSFHRLSAFVLHDLKNLVAQQSFVIQNAPRFRSDPAFLNDAFAAFEDSTNRMRALIGRLRTGGSDGPSAEAGCDLLELLQEILATRRLALRNGYRVQFVTPEGVARCPVAVDRSALAQLFTNLLVNAIESLPAAAGEITIALVPAGEGWRVEVRDNGCGIPETFQQDRLFRPFCTTKASGLGIGLYQCKAIVEAAGGSIAVDSTENIGTTVAVTLPTPSPAGNGVSARYG